ncbi:MAG TPA: GNAT family N-acetyltransferase, partial [Marmoricola sp.]
MSDPSKYAVRESERKFLLARAPEGLPPGTLIEDTYLPGTRMRLRRVTDPDGTVVRKLGQKVRAGGPDSLWHTTMYLDDDEWAELSRPGAPLRKRRHLVGDPAVAVDVFEGDLGGLVLAEVDRGEGPDEPDLLARLGDLGLDVVREVTGDESWTGGALAYSGRPDAAPVPGSGVLIRAYREPDWAAMEPIIREVLEAGETYCADAAMTTPELRRFWLSDAHTVVAEVDGVVVATAHCGSNRPAQGAHVGTASFMVGAAARGHGVGRALGEYVV